MAITILASGLVFFALTGNVVAQEAQRECGDFDYGDQMTQRVSATEILEDLRNCDLRVVNAIVDGDLILGPESRFKGDAIFINTSFEGDANFGGSTFEGSADFGDATFRGSADFGDATFRGDADFGDATFKGDADFGGITFQGRADFGGITFEDRADFSSSTFMGGALIDGTDFKGRATFADATFEDQALFVFATFRRQAIFDKTTFKVSANFTGSTFMGNASFGLSTFEGPAVFKDITFESSAFFRSTTFKGPAYFGDATFEGYTDFSSPTFMGAADFRSAVFIEELLFRPASFSEIWPPNASNIFTDITWNQVSGTFPEGTNKIDMHGRWEDFFTKSRRFADAEQVRTSRRRIQLHKWLWGIGGGFLGGWFLFTPLYYWRFRRIYRRSQLRHILKLVAFSLDVISPSIRPWKFDWDLDGGFPVRRVTIITAIESAFGWILLALGSAITVAWLTA